MKGKILYINGREVEFDKERNILEICRRVGIDIPTFCYQPELSVHGACRLCLVEIEGRGVQASCSTPPEVGLKVTTESEQLQKLRKINLELLLASHPQDCLTCGKSTHCKLQAYTKRFGVDKIRYKKIEKSYPDLIKKNVPEYAAAGQTACLPQDCSSPALVRDTAKCILCGCCVRACRELQSVGALGFAFRGSQSFVLPAFGKGLGKGQCVNCGQCAAVCPVGALMPRSQVQEVFKAVFDKSKVCVAAIAPAVRVALGDEFGESVGAIVTGKIVTALKNIGFDYVFDICHAADFTILEEGSEFIKRKTSGENLPQFTSCCPGWVKFVEQTYPELNHLLSSCKSPQQMFGAFAQEYLPQILNRKREEITIVSVMPCTAKKFEAQRQEFKHAGLSDIDIVITTQELATMIRESGQNFKQLKPSAFDKPFGVQTGAGMIFGVSGGVTEAALRFAAEKLTGQKAELEFKQVRGEGKGIRRAVLNVAGVELKLALVSGLANARQILEAVKCGKEQADLIEVMACPGGCINGGGQPYHLEGRSVVRKLRSQGLYKADKLAQIKNSQDNPDMLAQYQNSIGEIGSHHAHELFHTHYENRKE
ncbi:MAG: [FeFe] hydrogenase, group A [Deltaproteobacteria bacterium]|jgi:NADH-quinone oxidoreductase subunit G|nr:[FeFe] hydrogenase, group A [Deltaproteobacteria bacterium]